MPQVAIALSTYNGGHYLSQMLDSIRRQSLSDWTLLVRDDGSTDQTPDIIAQAAAADGRIVLLEGGPRLGATGSFGRLFAAAHRLGTEYLFPADQDDVWHDDKLAVMTARLQAVEQDGERRRPALVYSDLTVVDAKLRPVHPSFLRYSRQRHGEGRPLRTLLGRSFALGCAAAANRLLLDFALPMPAEAVSHDWWLALCAAAVGRIGHVNRSTLDYRRHGGNVSGPAGFFQGFLPWRHSWRRRWDAGRRSFHQSLAQAFALRRRLIERRCADSAEALELVDRFCEIFSRPDGALRRIAQLQRLGVPRLDLPRRLLYYLCVGLLARRPRGLGIYS
jgi:rhamnosyltransferase